MPRATTGSGRTRWPDPLNDTRKDRATKVFDAKAEIAKKHAEAVDARAQSEVQAELEVNAEYYKTIFEVGKGTLERSRAGATAVVTAAAAVVTLYTGLLSASFAVANDAPLPARGAVPAILLGAAIVLATFYLAYLGRSGTRWVATAQPTSSLRGAELGRAVAFLSWMRESALRRSYWLRASVIALGFGVMLLPAPFISLGHVHIGGWSIAGESSADASSVEKPPWPGTPAETDNIALQKIVYQAQVDEAVNGRNAAKPPGPSGDDGLWFAFAGVALVLTFGLAALGGTGQEKQPGPHDMPTTETAAGG